MAAKLTFFASPFFDEAGNEQRLSLTVEVEDGDYQGIIDAVRKDGGSLIPQGDGLFWFMPWPPAAIKIEPA